MTQAFVKESNDRWLQDVAPAIHSPNAYLSRENNNIKVYEKKMILSYKENKELHEMSNGLTYTKDNNCVWCVI